jgi:DNA-binding transcriptional MerR regulator/effector-binding domain-containing protein
VTATLSIGEFSKLTHLSVKTLRHYHDVGLLVPAGVDSGSRYRRYDAAQTADAQLIRRLRALDMPIEMVRTVVTTADSGARQATIAAHLEAMEAELERTKDVVASLRTLLEQPVLVAGVERRRLPAQTALAIGAEVAAAHVDHWCGAAFVELRGVVAGCGAEVDGPAGGLFSPAFFADDVGPVSVYVPVRAVPRTPRGRAGIVEVPAGEVLVATHHGPYADLDRTYAVLGAAANERGLAGDGAIRELYVVGPDATDDPQRFRTEVCWPIVDAA